MAPSARAAIASSALPGRRRFWSLDGDLKAARGGKDKPAKKAAAKKAAKGKAKKAAKKGKPSRAASKGDAYGCGVCTDTFATLKAATKHAAEAHLA